MHKTIVATIGMKRARYLTAAATTSVAGLLGQRRTSMLERAAAATIIALVLPPAANAQSATISPATEVTVRTGNDLIQSGN